MENIINATDVRREWGKFIDDVVHGVPKVVKRNRDSFISLSIDHIRAILKNYTFAARYFNEDDGSITATLNDFDIVVNALDQESARIALAEELIEYANEYYDEFQLYYNSKNRQSHFPYVMAILLQDGIEGVVKLIA